MFKLLLLLLIPLYAADSKGFISELFKLFTFMVDPVSPGEMDPASIVQWYETELQKESLPGDIFDMSVEDVTLTEEKTITIPDEIYMRLNQGTTGSRTIRVTLLNALSDDPTEGTANDQEGNEEIQQTKSFVARYNDVSHAVSGQSYGLFKLDRDSYKIFEQIQPQLSRYFAQYYGKQRRVSLLERYSENLLEAPHNADLVAEFGPNWFIPGLNNSEMPVYNANPALWVEALGDALTAAGTSLNANCTVQFLLRLNEWASSRLFIRPLMVDGQERYIYIMPSSQSTFFSDSTQAGTLGNVYVNQSGLTKEEMAFPGVIGRVKKILICVDDRYPTLGLGGSDGSWTLTAGYRNMGNGPNSEGRDFSAAARDVGFLLGPGCLCEWKPEDLHFESEFKNYQKYYGRGAFMSWACQQVQWDVGTNPTSATRQQFSSIITPFAKPPWA